MSESLTEKQQAFVDEMLIDFNASAAARRAGYSAHRANAIGYENLTKPDIQAALRTAIEARRERTEITQDRVVQELARIAFADIRDLFTWDEEHTCFVPSTRLTADQAAAISAIKAKTTRVTREDGTEEQHIELELKTYDKRGALELLAKHLGMLTERHQIQANTEQRVVLVAETVDGRRRPLAEMFPDGVPRFQ